eukprot:GFYU01004684.1.p1 GENE.GFYU01004684.1~~GFYU01004684.1.p1  ORF type:complete len:246 (-),score=94.29 GFYU01004684.1:210-947(-)
MASLKNAINIRAHKERSQIAERRQFGFLEKKKDYKLRAKDFSVKRKKMKVMQEKAALKNPDEFYFAMQKSQLKNGVHRDDPSTPLSTAQVKLMKTQDVGYLTMKNVVDKKKIERIQDQTLFLDGPKKNKHTLFVEDKKAMKKFKATEYFNTPKELVKQSHNRLRQDQLDEVDVAKGLTENDMKSLDRERARKYKEMLSRLEREEKIGEVLQTMHTQRAGMTKGRKKKVTTDEGKTFYKFKMERKR